MFDEQTPDVSNDHVHENPFDSAVSELATTDSDGELFDGIEETGHGTTVTTFRGWLPTRQERLDNSHAPFGRLTR